MNNEVIIIGYSGHAFVVLDTWQKLGKKLKYYCAIHEADFNPFDLNYLGNEGDMSFDWSSLNTFILGIGDNSIREQIYQKISTRDKTILNVIHPSAVINGYVSIGDGNYISSNAIINTLVKIGNGCIINSGAIIEHECTLDNFVHIGPGAVLAGNVIIGERTFIGANAVIKQGVKIGVNVIIGAGSVLLKDVLDNEVWVGNPAKKINTK